MAGLVRRRTEAPMHATQVSACWNNAICRADHTRSKAKVVHISPLASGMAFSFTNQEPHTIMPNPATTSSSHTSHGSTPAEPPSTGSDCNAGQELRYPPTRCHRVLLTSSQRVRHRLDKEDYNNIVRSPQSTARSPRVSPFNSPQSTAQDTPVSRPSRYHKPFCYRISGGP